MKVAIVVPWRGGNPQREANWAYCKPWWERFGWPIVQVHHTGNDPFNRAWCINEGARRAFPWDAIVVVDADVVEESHDQVREAVDVALRTNAFTIAHSVGKDLSHRGTERVFSGEEFDWNRECIAVRDGCESRVNVFSRDMFEELGGYDTRFEGWGHEDVAFSVAAATLQPFQRVDGACWHLWHEPMLPIARRTREWRMGNGLAQKYIRQAQHGGWNAVKAVMDGRGPEQQYRRPFPTEPPAPVKDAKVDMVMLTNGRLDYLAQTMDSVRERIKGNVVSRTLIDDSGSEGVAEVLRSQYPDWQHVTHGTNLGFADAMRAGRDWVAANGSAPYVLWLEDDFVFTRDILLDEMATVLEVQDIVSCVLLRGPAYPLEYEAGGIIEEHPHSYIRAVHNGVWYLKHSRFYSSNPHLARRESYTTFKWPHGRDSEHRFGRLIRQKRMSYAFLGDGTPYMEHIGADRRDGHGY